MDFGVLGPLEMRAGGVRLDVGGVRDQKVLAALLLSADQAVSLGQLVDVVWDDDPPSTSKHQIHKIVGKLRGLLRRSDAGTAIETDGQSYRLVLAGGTLDARVFEERVALAGQTAADGDMATSAAQLHAALGLWRGSALAGLTSRALDSDADRLNDRRVSVAERCFGLELERGRHQEVIADLTALVAAYPFREQLAEQLMLALYRSDRQAEALEVYVRTRLALDEELGVEPGRSLRDAYHSILNQEAEEEPEKLVPAQLPADLARFTGRADHLTELDELLGDAPAVVITAIAGTAGVGKTALAVHWAHRVRDRFPDGQLYLNLRGYDDVPPVSTTEALTQFLRALGVEPEMIPREIDEQSALYRSLLANRRMLVLLDNASSEQQVRPLLPGSAGSAVVVTSRSDLRGLTALDDAYRVVLDVLSPAEAEALLSRVLGKRRVDAEPEAARELAALCGHLPLALRIAGANLAFRPRDRIADAVADLGQGDRLAKLAIRGDQRAVVTAAFDLSYQTLPPDAQCLFRRLGLLPRTDFTPHAAAALTGASPMEAAALIEVLESASLVEPHTHGRFRLHDLLRLYAQDLVRSDDERDAARRRLLEFYLHATDAALDVLTPDMSRQLRTEPGQAVPLLEFTTRSDALAWLDGERESLVTSVLQCAADGPREFAWHLADALRRYFFTRKHFEDWRNTATAGLQAATGAGDPLGQASSHGALGAYYMDRDPHEGIVHYEAALRLYRELDHSGGQFHCFNNLGILLLLLGRTAEAIDLFENAMALSDTPARAAIAVSNLGGALWQAARLSDAREHLERSINEIGGLAPDKALMLMALAQICADLGRLDEARGHADVADTLVRELNAPAMELHGQLLSANLDRATGHPSAALDRAQWLVKHSDEWHSYQVGLVAAAVTGSVHHHNGDLTDAVAVLERGLGTARAQDRVFHEVWLTVDLARALHAARDPRALTYAENALKMATERDYHGQRGRALATLACVHFGLGDPGRARELASQALAIQEYTEYRLGQAEALLVLGHLLESESHLQAARDIFAHHTGDPDIIPAGVLCPSDLAGW